jgi:hypothetical protein
MAFNTTKLRSDILQAFDDQAKKTSDSAAARNDLATKLSAAIESYVKAIKVAEGISVETAGSATAQKGCTTAQGTLE